MLLPVEYLSPIQNTSVQELYNYVNPVTQFIQYPSVPKGDDEAKEEELGGSRCKRWQGNIGDGFQAVSDQLQRKDRYGFVFLQEGWH